MNWILTDTKHQKEIKLGVLIGRYITRIGIWCAIYVASKDQTNRTVSLNSNDGVDVGRYNYVYLKILVIYKKISMNVLKN